MKVGNDQSITAGLVLGHLGVSSQDKESRAGLVRAGDKMSASYWFVPSSMAFLAAILAGLVMQLDSDVGSEWMDWVGWLYAAHLKGARQMMSSIGGAIITVAGTVFSVTIAAVVYTSGQYAPRLLTNFMRDRENQMTLGTFIATFLYCLVVLRTIRSADESGGYLLRKEDELAHWNDAKGDGSVEDVNRRRFTNLGTFRAYVIACLHSRKDISAEKTLIVRQLAPSSDGLPLEICAFTETIVWSE